MIRKLVIILLSVAFAGTALSTVASFWRVIEFKLYGLEGGEEEFTRFSARKGILSVLVKESIGRGSTGPGAAPPPSARFSFVGVEYWDSRGMTTGKIGPGGKLVGTVYRFRIVKCPAWIVLFALAAYPTIAFIRGPLRLWRRRKRGLCVTCGYDLTGNVSGVCPECAGKVGQVTARQSATPSTAHGRAG